MIGSLPSWECGLKLSHHKRLAVLSYVTPFVGVWIEITVVQISCIATNASLPSWECGLKYNRCRISERDKRVTPFVGVWIEIA